MTKELLFRWKANSFREEPGSSLLKHSRRPEGGGLNDRSDNAVYRNILLISHQMLVDFKTQSKLAGSLSTDFHIGPLGRIELTIQLQWTTRRNLMRRVLHADATNLAPPHPPTYTPTYTHTNSSWEKCWVERSWTFSLNFGIRGKWVCFDSGEVACLVQEVKVWNGDEQRSFWHWPAGKQLQSEDFELYQDWKMKIVQLQHRYDSNKQFSV